MDEDQTLLRAQWKPTPPEPVYLYDGISSRLGIPAIPCDLCCYRQQGSATAEVRTRRGRLVPEAETAAGGNGLDGEPDGQDEPRPCKQCAYGRQTQEFQGKRAGTEGIRALGRVWRLVCLNY